MHIFGIEITLFQVFATIAGVGFLVFIHELGHFAMAKKFGIRVERFQFGFGPEIVGFTYGETRYAWCAIPLGGLVKMPGEDINDTTGSPDEFLSQPWYRRLLIAFFGPLMNYLLAIVLFTVVIAVWGLSKPSPEPVVGSVVAGYPAEKAGIKAGDRILSVKGKPVATWEELAGTIHQLPGQTVVLAATRDGQPLTFTLEPSNDPASGRGLIGIAPAMVTERVGVIRSTGYAAKVVVIQSVFTLKYLGEKLVRWEKPEVAGPIGVVQILASAAKSGWEQLLNILGMISVALGLFNLLPIPLVDGGHIIIALIEGITRRAVSKKLIQTSNIVGLAIILFIFVFATYSDLARLGVNLLPK